MSGEPTSHTVSHSSCGLAECSWIDCADHQWNGGKACDEGWFALHLANVLARMFTAYAARAGFSQEDAADLSQNVFYAQAFGTDSAADAAVALAWAMVTVVSAPGGCA